MKDSEKAVFLKEYTCYDFALFHHEEAVVKQQPYNCLFEETKGLIKSNPPAVIVDIHQDPEVLYILQWLQNKQQILLYIKQLGSQTWMQFRMNAYPDFITISGGSIFIVGGSQLFILVPFNYRMDLIKLQKDKIVGIYPHLSENISIPDILEPSVYIIFQDERSRYYSGHYSIQGKKVTLPQLFTRVVDRLSQKKEVYLHLEVLIPNVIGLLFTDKGRMYILNLGEMKIEGQTAIQIPCQRLKPLIRWRKQQSKSVNEVSLFILINLGNEIFSFAIEFSLKDRMSQILSKFAKSQNLLLDSSIIIWSTLDVFSLLTYVIEGNNLVDMTISTRGFIYISQNNSVDLIYTCQYIELDQFPIQCQIMMLESNIWRLHYEDKWEGIAAHQNRLISPNRYSYRLVNQVFNQTTPQMDRSLKCLSKWRQNYSYSALQTYNEELLIVRKGSIGIFRSIEKKMFQQENLSINQLHLIESEYLNEYRFQIDNSDNLSLFFGLEVVKRRGLLEERKYVERDDDIQKLEVQNKESEFAEALTTLKSILFERHNERSHNLVIDEFKFQLVCLQIQDSFSSLNSATVLKLFHSRGLNHQFQKEYCQFGLIVKVLEYFYELYHRSADHYNYLDFHLIEQFIRRNVTSLSNDINVEVSKILKQLLTQFFIPGQNHNEMSINNYLQFLVKIYIERYDSQQDQALSILRKQMSKIVCLARNSHQLSTFLNQSLFKILLLSQESQLLEQVVVLKLLDKSFEIFHEIYCDLKYLLEEWTIEIVEKQIYLNYEIKPESIRIDRSGLNFSKLLSTDANSEVSRVFYELSEQFLTSEAGFIQQFERFDSAILDQLSQKSAY